MNTLLSNQEGVFYTIVKRAAPKRRLILILFGAAFFHIIGKFTYIL